MFPATFEFDNCTSSNIRFYISAKKTSRFPPKPEKIKPHTSIRTHNALKNIITLFFWGGGSLWGGRGQCVCVCVCLVIPFILGVWLVDVPAGVTQDEGHTGFLIHLPSAVHAFIFLARRIQPFLSLVDRGVKFCVLITN